MLPGITPTWQCLEMNFQLWQLVLHILQSNPVRPHGVVRTMQQYGGCVADREAGQFQSFARSGEFVKPDRNAQNPFHTSPALRMRWTGGVSLARVPVTIVLGSQIRGSGPFSSCVGLGRINS